LIKAKNQDALQSREQLHICQKHSETQREFSTLTESLKHQPCVVLGTAIQDLSYQLEKHQAQLNAEHMVEYDVLDTLARLGGKEAVQILATFLMAILDAGGVASELWRQHLDAEALRNTLIVLVSEELKMDVTKLQGIDTAEIVELARER
jgi:hypothetical protein